jgi:hypothetical protein
VDKCKALGRAMRIGTNHGSLSARILSYYGDTPRGMVESAFEFADICRDADYHNFLFSMKASNPLVMVQAYRLLAEEQYARGWDYPLHLGVTEARARRRPGHRVRGRAQPAFSATAGTADWPAHVGRRVAPGRTEPACEGSGAAPAFPAIPSARGAWAGRRPADGRRAPRPQAGEGEDGRMKSAIGIGSLLMDGLGDTIRVSLTEDPEKEIDPCQCGPLGALCLPVLCAAGGRGRLALGGHLPRDGGCAPESICDGALSPCILSPGLVAVCVRGAPCSLRCVAGQGNVCQDGFRRPGGPGRRGGRRQLVALGARAMEGGWGVEPFGGERRDTHTFARRVGRLPEQRAGDRLDYRPLLHRDGSVLSALTLQARARPRPVTHPPPPGARRSRQRGPHGAGARARPWSERA